MGGVAYLLGLAGWVAPWLAAITESTRGHAYDFGPIPSWVMFQAVPGMLAAVVAVSAAIAMGRTRSPLLVVLVGALSASAVFSAIAVSFDFADGLGRTLTEHAVAARTGSARAGMPVPSEASVLGSAFAGALGAFLSVPALVLALTQEEGPRSHDDADRLTAFAGFWMMLGPALPTSVAMLGVDYPCRQIVGSVQVAIVDVGFGVFAWGLVRSFLRRRWLARARRGELQGVRVRTLGPTEAPPRVLPLIRLSRRRRISVIEIVERPTSSAYRAAEIVHPIALA